MKKLIALLLVLVMVLSLAACAKKNENTDDQKDQSQSQNKNGDDSQNDDHKLDDSNKNKIDFDEIVVLDNEECVIKITDIDPDNVMGYALKGYFENKSAEMTYMFSVDSATINGIQCDPYFATEVAPGKKSNDTIYFSVDLLEMDGIGDFTDIDLNFGVYDSEDWLSDPVAQTTVHVYPYGEDKAVEYVREDKDTDVVLIDNEYVKVIAIGTLEDDWGYNVVLYLQSKSDKNLMISADEVSVNGFMIDPFFGTEVGAGNCGYDEINWSLTELEDNGITDVIKIEFKLYVSDSDDWEVDDYAVETIVYHP